MVKNHESSFISLELCSPNKIPTLQLKKLLGFYTSCFSVSTKKSWHIYKGKRLAIRAGSKPTYYRQKVPCIHHFHAWNLKEIRKFLWFSKVFPGPCLVSVRPKMGNQKLCLLNKRYVSFCTREVASNSEFFLWFLFGAVYSPFPKVKIGAPALARIFFLISS